LHQTERRIDVVAESSKSFTIVCKDKSVSGLNPGIYRYRPQTQILTPILAGDRRGELCAAALHQVSIKKAPA
jgi:hypothetical protein